MAGFPVGALADSFGEIIDQHAHPRCYMAIAGQERADIRFGHRKIVQDRGDRTGVDRRGSDDAWLHRGAQPTNRRLEQRVAVIGAQPAPYREIRHDAVDQKPPALLARRQVEQTLTLGEFAGVLRIAEDALLLASGNITHDLGGFRGALAGGGEASTDASEFPEWMW